MDFGGLCHEDFGTGFGGAWLSGRFLKQLPSLQITVLSSSAPGNTKHIVKSVLSVKLDMSYSN